MTATESLVCDTNVALVANGDAPQASEPCKLECIRQLEQIMRDGRLVLDSVGLILNQYLAQRPFGWPRGIGDWFFIWAVTHQADPHFCSIVDVTPTDKPRRFVEFPEDEELTGFDPDDRIFVAVAIASGTRPPVLNAADTDWWEHRAALSRHGVEVRFLCPELMTREG